jgi:hypothetical protein
MMAVYRHQLAGQIPVAAYTTYLPRGSTERLLRNLGVGIIERYPTTTLLAPPWQIQAGFLSEVEGAEFHIGFTWVNGERLETRTYATPLGEVTARIRQEPTYGIDFVVKLYQ